MADELKMNQAQRRTVVVRLDGWMDLADELRLHIRLEGPNVGAVWEKETSVSQDLDQMLWLTA